MKLTMFDLKTRSNRKRQREFSVLYHKFKALKALSYHPLDEYADIPFNIFTSIINKDDTLRNILAKEDFFK